jgi:hypothetical protein
MSNAKEFLKGLCAMAKGHNDTLAAHHSESDPVLAKHHEQMATDWHNKMNECQKAIDSDMQKIVPDRVMGILPSDPPQIKPVPRVGQPQPAFDSSGCPPELLDFLKVDL